MKPKKRTKPVRIYLSEKEFADLVKYAKRNDVYMAEAAREFILRGLKGLCHEVMRGQDSGL